jgi:alpha-galactosidase/6-phospho-beta-glucosidase family protein
MSSEHVPYTPRSRVQIQDITAKVIDNDPELKKVNLRGTELSANDAKKIIESLKNNSAVEVVDFSNNITLDDNAVDYICDLIECSTSVRKLYLDGTAVTKVSRILHAMKHNKKIIDMTLPEAASEEDEDLLEEILDENEKQA